MKTVLKKDIKTGIILNQPAEEYHSAEGYIQSSPLPFMAISPAHFFYRWNNGVEPTPKMDNGTFCHALALEQDIGRFVARPKKNGRLVATNTEEYKIFLADNIGKTPVEPELYNEAELCLDTICENPAFMDTHAKCYTEVSVYAVDDETGLAIKTRADFMPKWLCDAILKNDISMFSGKGPEDLFIVDFKSTGTLRNYKNLIYTLGYDVRLFHYWHTIRCLIKQQFNIDIGLPHKMGFIAMEQSAPFGSKNFEIEPHEILEASKLHRQYLNEISVCLEENKFPSYSHDWIKTSRPAFIKDSEIDFEGVG